MSSDPPKPCPYCGIPVTGAPHGCTGLFKEIMTAPAESALDELPPEARAFESDETRKLNDYILVEQIGKGGMGTVWKAWDRKLTRWVAVKFLNGQDEDDFARFSREAKLAARLRHPNIAAVFDTGEVPSRHAGRESVRYLAMEYLEGQSVATAELPLAKWIETFARIARAVDHAHQSGVVHRDLKPTNLMLTRDGWPYVMDFGLAKSLKAGSSVSISGVILGTPAFMPPEQAAGRMRDIDARSDIYSLGATLYYVLTRQEPHRGEDPMDVIVRVLQKDPPRPREIVPDLPEGIEAIVLKAMARVKEARYATAGEMADDLERLLAAGPTALAAPQRSRTPLVFAVVAVALAASIWAGVFFRPAPVAAPVPAPLQKPSPLPAFLDRLRELKDAKKWREARAWVDEGGAFLNETERARYGREVEDDCLSSLQKITAALFAGVVMEKLETPSPDFRFATLLADLPARERVILPHAAYEWTLQALPALDGNQSGVLVQAAVQAVALDDAGENPWFRAAEVAAHRALLRDLVAQTKRARGAARAVVQECRSAARSIAEPWEAFLRGMPPAFRSRHAALLDRHDEAVRGAREDFPEDPPFLQEIDVGAILNQPDAERRLDELERKLRALDGGKLTRESQRSLLLHLVTARALGGAFRGATSEQVAGGLREFAAALKDQGVTEEERSRFGPKVAAVIDRLLR
jgi:serine/threonine protein kinase